MEERSTGHAAPTPIPIVIGSAAAKLILPVTDNACKIPTEADAHRFATNKGDAEEGG